jgi:hypothetical protein
MRGRGMKRCRAEGAERFALFVGVVVLVASGIKAAASNHIASHNFAWQNPRPKTTQQELVPWFGSRADHARISRIVLRRNG